MSRKNKQARRRAKNWEKISQRLRDATATKHWGDELSLGKRYVFFSSLQAQKEKWHQRIYVNAYNEGTAYVAEAAALLSNNPMKNSLGSLGNIELYINFVADLMNNAHNNEADFLRQFYAIAKDKNNGIPDSLVRKFDKLEKSDYSDYIAFLGAIDEIMANRDEAAKQRTEGYDQLMRDYQTRINALQQSEDKSLKYSTLRDAFRQNIGTFNQQFNAIIVQGMDTFHQTYANLVSEKINSTISNLAENAAFISQIKEEYTKNTNFSPQECGQRILTYITQTILDKPDSALNTMTGQELATFFMQDFEAHHGKQLEQLSKEFLITINNQITKKRSKNDTKSIEELALTTGRGTASKFLLLGDDAAVFLDKYFPQDMYPTERGLLQNLFNKVNGNRQTATALEKQQASKIINTRIVSHIGIALDIQGETINQLRKKIEKEMPTQVQQFFQTYGNGLLKDSLGLKISGSGISEIIASEEFRQEMVKAIVTPGKTIQLKNDITAVISFNNNIFKAHTQSKKLKAVQDVLKSIPEEFIKKYHEEAKGNTDVQAAQKAYINIYQKALADLKSIYTKGNKIEKQYELALQALHDMFITGVSIKDYQYGTNEMGFEGGSLGSNIDNILNNITNMYELGGISVDDAETLKFAAMNCGSDMLGANLKEPLQTYLLGAAAVLMFDEGFTDTSGFLQKMRDQLNGFDGSKPLHLFRLQTHYVPASYVYATIYYNLEAAYHSISSSFIPEIMSQASSSVVINNIDQRAIPSFLGMPIPQDRWDSVSNTANANTQIKFIFMAGLLDVFESIANAFNV